MDGPVVEHSDSDSGDSWTILENSVYADEAPDFSEILESPAGEKHEKDEDTDGISVISDSEPDSHSPSDINFETVSDANRPPEHDTAEYISVNPHLSNLQTDTKSLRNYDLLGDNKQKNKTYVHRRNKRLSTVLNIVVLASVITAAGVAIGHMWGAKTDCTLHNTPGVNKILSSLYRLQEENVYLREKIREITVLTNYQASYHKAQMKQNKCKKVFEESLHSNNNKPTTTCVDKQYDDIKLPKNQLSQQSHEKEFGSNIDKMEDAYQENRSLIDESIKRTKLEKNRMEKESNPFKSNLARPKRSQKLKYSANVIAEVEENSNDNIAKMADDKQKTSRYTKTLTSNIEDDSANKKINMHNEDKDLYNKQQKIERQDNKFQRLDKKFNKRDRNDLFEAKSEFTKPQNRKREFGADNDFSFEIQARNDKRFSKSDRDRILDTQIDSDVEFFKENDINEYKKSTAKDKKEFLDVETDLNKPVDAKRECSSDKDFSFEIKGRNIKNCNKRHGDRIIYTQIDSDIKFFNEYDSDPELFNDYNMKEDERNNPDNSLDNDGKISTGKENKNGKTDDNGTKDKQFFKIDNTKVFALKEEIDKRKLRYGFGRETDSFIGDNLKDNRYMGQKPKQNRKKYDRSKSHKKDKRRNKYEQWEMKGGLLKDYDDISFASSQDSGFLIKDNFKGEVESDFVIVSNDLDKSEEQDDDDEDKTECYIKQNRKDNDYWQDKRAISREEARRHLEKELFDGNVNAAGWYFRRMRKREQCRAKGDNSTYRKLSKRFKNFKTKK